MLVYLVTFNACNCAATGTQNAEALAVFLQLRRERLKHKLPLPDTEVYAAIMAACQSGDMLTEAAAVMKSMHSDGVPRSLAVYQSLLR
jgi:pentatricopeptide repeat protein